MSVQKSMDSSRSLGLYPPSAAEVGGFKECISTSILDLEEYIVFGNPEELSEETSGKLYP
jgi:hypothetical protein